MSENRYENWIILSVEQKDRRQYGILKDENYI